MMTEKLHNLALAALRAASLLPFRGSPRHTWMPRTVGGVHFRNPVGLAAGFDKDGVAAPALAALGFGFLTVGTVTPGAQAGNPKPRLFRDPKNKAIWNAMGFPGSGAEALAARLRRMPALPIPLGISVGAGRHTPLEYAAGDYVRCMELLEPYPDFFEICISSPNTPGLRELQTPALLDDLLRQLPRRKPVWIKFAPDHWDLPVALQICAMHRVDAVIIGNSTLDPSINPDPDKGGYSGHPLYNPGALQDLGTPLPIVACGGISTGSDVAAMLNAGATLVQLYSSIVYRGPFVARKIREELLCGKRF